MLLWLVKYQLNFDKAREFMIMVHTLIYCKTSPQNYTIHYAHTDEPILARFRYSTLFIVFSKKQFLIKRKVKFYNYDMITIMR